MQATIKKIEEKVSISESYLPKWKRFTLKILQVEPKPKYDYRAYVTLDNDYFRAGDIVESQEGDFYLICSNPRKFDYEIVPFVGLLDKIPNPKILSVICSAYQEL